MTNRAVVDHLDAALAIAKHDREEFLAYLILMAKAAAEQAEKQPAKQKLA